MARKQTSGRLNRFLDLIGLVDSERDETEQEAPSKAARTAAARRAAADDDEFGDFDEPAPARARRTSGASAQTARRSNRLNVENDGDEFGESQGWTNAAPGYAARTARTRTSPQPRTTAANSSARQTYSTRSGYRTGSSYGYAGERRSSATAYGDAQPRYRSAGATAGHAAAARSETAGAFEAPPPVTGYQRHQTIIFKLRSVDECKDVILSLIDKKSVLMSLEALDSVQAQRSLDTMSGAAFAIGATLSRASDKTWLITPSNVEVERSSQDEDGYGGYN